MTRLLRVEDIPLTDPELVYREATFERPPPVFVDSCRVLNFLEEHAEKIGDKDLNKRFRVLRFSITPVIAIFDLLCKNPATDQPSMFAGRDILVCFCTFAEIDSDDLLDEIGAILTSAVYDFQPVPEIAALLPTTYGATYFS